MSETKDIKTKSELMDSFVQIAIARGFSDYDGEAERFINETVSMYDNLPQPQLTIPKSVADALDVGDLIFLAWTHGNDLLGKLSNEERNAECRRRNAIAKAYLAGKALGVDLVKVVEG